MSTFVRHRLPAFWLVLVLAVPVTAAAARAARHAPMAPAARSMVTREALREAMRKLWTDHVVWTREYVVAAVDGSPAAGAAANRLMKNQDEIGRAIAPFYGADAGNKLTALLKQHIAIAVDLVTAAKASDQGAFQAANAKWKQNASDIARFLAGANPNWPSDAMTEAMNMHLETTAREVTDRLQKKYDDDVAAFDAVYEHILHMSDVLADGIVKQFPARFAD